MIFWYFRLAAELRSSTLNAILELYQYSECAEYPGLLEVYIAGGLCIIRQVVFRLRCPRRGFLPHDLRHLMIDSDYLYVLNLKALRGVWENSYQYLQVIQELYPRA
jgi:hypothetical protein